MKQKVQHYMHVHPSHKVLVTGGFIFASVLLIDLAGNLSKLLG